VNGDSFIDPLTGDKIFGRLTYAAGPPTWTLSFYTYPAGGPETLFNMTPFSGPGLVFSWYCQEVFQLDAFPWADPMFAITSDQVAAEIPDATTAVKGKVLLAPNGGIVAATVVQANDSRLLPINALTVLRKLASKPSLIFYPHDGTGVSPNAYDTYRLHQFHGLAKGDFRIGVTPYEPADFYFEFDKTHSDYPLNVTFNGVTAQAGVGLADNTRPPLFPNTWYYVYLIGRNPTTPGTKKLALVFSDRPPWAGGPLLDDTGVPPPGFKFWNGGVQGGISPDEGLWRYWRFIGCVVQGTSGVFWELVPLRKKGDHVEYELAQGMFKQGPDFTWTPVSLATRVPPTSLRAFLRVRTSGKDAQVWGEVRPPALGVQKLHDIPVGGPPWPASLEYKLQAVSFGQVGGGGVDGDSDTGWVDTNEARDVDVRGYNAPGGAPADRDIWLEVLGYEELDDSENTEHAWP
jgi:hypothetical protein